MFVPLIAVLISTVLTLGEISAGVPKPAWDCMDEKIIAKYFDEPCASHGDCFGRHMKCESGKCKCLENCIPEERFVGEQAKQTVCVPAPLLHAECSTICQKPYTCKEHAEFKKKICHCEPPFKLVDNYCHLECAENEQYDNTKFACVPKCKGNEIKVNETCLMMGNLNDKCQVDKQCLPGFSECKNGQCACLPGFVAQDGLCMAEELRCPHGQIIKTPIRCIFMKDPENKVWGSMTDNCTQGHYCQSVSGDYRSENSEGFCCPRIESQCPVGQPHLSASCRNNPSFKENDKDCPWETHFCTRSSSGGYEVCCPKRCESSRIQIDGKCYPPARLNDPCLNDKQCTESRTACVNGVCKCKGKAVEKKRSNYAYCSVECQPNEILHDEECHKLLSLGDSCQNQTWRCPANAFCNKFNVCSCTCPRFTLSKDICAPVPMCPGPKRHYPYARSGMMAMEMTADSKYYQPISDDKRKELLENVTFCTIPGQQPPKVEYVEQCPEGQYCAMYISNLGMCCKTPEFVCPSGKKPTSVKNCTVNNALSCGLKQYCHDYLYTADSNTTEGKMCCEKDEFNNLHY